MKFLFPTFLFALLTIAIPVIIHLFSFRRHKTVYFSNVEFLKYVKKESKKKSRLKQLLLLIARILTIIFLVFAFSQPYIPQDSNVKKQAGQIVGIYIDNSFSMNALSEQGQLLEVARNKAVEICLAYPQGTKFKIFTNDLLPKHQHIFNREQFIRQVSEITTSPDVTPLSVIYNRFLIQKEEKNSDKLLYLISDFQRNNTDIENFGGEELFCYFIKLTPNQVNNLYIDSCWVEIPAHRLNQEENIFVRIKNSSNQDYQNLPLKLYLNDSIKSITNFSVSAQNEITASLRYTNNSSGQQLGKVKITDYPFTHDNNWAISYHVAPNLKALAIYSKSQESKEGLRFMQSLFESDNYIKLDSMNSRNLQISKLSEYNAIFLLNQERFSSGFLNEIEKVAANGTSVIIFPGITNNPAYNNSFLGTFGLDLITGIDTTDQKISGIDFENSFYQNTFNKIEQNASAPEIDEHFKFQKNIRTNELPLLWFRNGDKALSLSPYKNGKIWTFSFPLNNKNESFARDILFVPTIYNIILNSLAQQDISYTIGVNTSYTIPKTENINLNSTIEILKPDTDERFIPLKSSNEKGTVINYGDLIKEDGHYLVLNNDTPVTALAFNYNRKESELRYFSNDEIKDQIESGGYSNASTLEGIEENFADIFNEIQHGKQLWKLCILLALLFILAEVLISRFMK